MKSVLFTNWTKESFTGYWDGKAKTFEPGEKQWMPEYLARHFAKHLTNRELLRTDKDGNLVYKNGDKMTSPKFPEQVPTFMELLNKAISETEEQEEMYEDDKNDIDAIIESANKNRELDKKPKKRGRPKKEADTSPEFDEQES